jgi:RNA polymerase sigma factor (sigma-70 family)
VIAIFVFASSIHGGASRLTAEEEANLLARRKERIQEVIRETKDLLSKQEKGHNNERVLQEWEAKIAGLTNDLKNIDRAIREAKNKAKALTVGQIVIIPSSLLLASIVASGIAVITSGILPIIMWILSLTLIIISLYFIYKKLVIIESFSSLMDLSTVIKEMFERPETKLKPTVDITRELKEEVAAVLRTLPPEESRIIEMYFGIGFDRMSLEEIAEEFGYSKRTIQTKLAIALRKCRHPSRSRRLRDYLDSIPIVGDKTGEQLFIEGIFGI